MVDGFNDPKGNFQLFLISTNAGGLGTHFPAKENSEKFFIGLNLTAASRVLLYDVSFNPANDYQACCRAYRYGQSNPVFIYRLVQFGTVEDAIWNRYFFFFCFYFFYIFLCIFYIFILFFIIFVLLLLF